MAQIFPGWTPVASDTPPQTFPGWTPVLAQPDFKTQNEPATDPGVLRGMADTLNPVPMMKALIDAYKAAPHGTDPVQFLGESMVKSLAGAHWAAIKKGWSELGAGNITEGVGHLAAGALPVIGPMAAKAGEDIGSGKPMYGIGEGLATILPFGLKYAKEVLQTGTLATTPARVAAAPPLTARLPAIAPNVNPAEAAAVDFGVSRGIPVDAGTASGNPVVRGTQKLAEHTSLAGAYVGNRAGQAMGESMARVGGELADTAHPTPVTSEQAGISLQSALKNKVDILNTKANEAYDSLRQREAASQPQTFSTHPGQPFQSMQMSVDLRQAKTALQPVYEQMRRQMPITQQQANPGLKALENIMTGPDFGPLSQVDRDLSAIKSIARTQGGLAKLAVSTVDEAVRKAAMRAGPDVLKSLEDGRAAVKARVVVEDALDSLRAEPVQAIRSLTAPKDSAIQQLRAVVKEVPEQAPVMARAYLEDLLGQATAEGGFQRGAKLQAEWQKLGTQTKQLLFPKPGQSQELDHFFLLAKKAADNPNPSGSAYVGGLLAHGYLFREPLSGIAYEITGGALAKALHTPAVVRVLTRGLSVPVGNQAAATAAANSILKAVGDAAVRVPTAAQNPQQTPDTRGQR